MTKEDAAEPKTWERNNFNLAEPVHIGSGKAFVAETSHISDAHVVHHDVEHIWTIAG